ncbi:glycine cleavage system protein GcvH [Desulfohalobium retbaense]|uniref:Glycine cleavage system H protein n=1 Tax=Desulfohalobium retbaense (strain ATCC 49708 / DSM 5692 / JCM 16813 / HR100) TaxID=485915 RepID=C8X364_DESRD|nr:glycine cleavage system protein GcvH [Desulfohalobium retbaense]ACV68861.1 glycine cleavage system H protein [Desulfohalobium retbaense DSM 5692]
MLPEDLLYTKSHEWVRVEDGQVTMGITHFAQEQLGDLTFVELPAPGDQVEAGQEIATVESVKAASEVYAPVSGEILAINEDLEDAPEKINADPYGEGWMVRIKTDGEPEGLMDAEAYTQHLSEQE